jgi:hypothetical protein
MKRIIALIALAVALAIPASSSAVIQGGGGGMPTCTNSMIGWTYTDYTGTYMCWYMQYGSPYWQQI